MSRRFLAAVAIVGALVVGSPAAADEVGPSSAPKYRAADITVTEASPLNAVVGKRFRVWSYTIQNRDASNNVTVYFAMTACNGTKLTPSWKLVANSTLEQPATSPYPQFESTTTNATVMFCLSALRDVSLAMTYTEFDPTATTYETSGPPSAITNSVLTTRDNHTTSDRLAVDLDASDVGAGGGSSCEEPCEVEIVAAGIVKDWRDETKLALFLLVFLVTVGAGVFVARRGRSPL